MALSKRLRYEILRRDSYTCRYCGASAPDVKITVDHVHPVVLGGKDDPTNLVAACGDCNSGKTSSNPDAPLVANVSADALRWNRAIATAIAERETDKEATAAEVQLVDHFWREWKVTSTEELIPRPPDWESRIRAMLSRGLPLFDICEAIPVAMKRQGVKDIWSYFCGINWRTLDDIEERAHQIIEREEVPVDG